MRKERLERLAAASSLASFAMSILVFAQSSPKPTVLLGILGATLATLCVSYLALRGSTATSSTTSQRRQIPRGLIVAALAIATLSFGVALIVKIPTAVWQQSQPPSPQKSDLRLPIDMISPSPTIGPATVGGVQIAPSPQMRLDGAGCRQSFEQVDLFLGDAATAISMRVALDDQSPSIGRVSVMLVANGMAIQDSILEPGPGLSLGGPVRGLNKVSVQVRSLSSHTRPCGSGELHVSLFELALV